MNAISTEDVVAEIGRLFPRAVIGQGDVEFIREVCAARERSVGFGFMRQVIGIAWRLTDPVGYIDDQRLVELATRPRPRRKAKKAKKYTRHR